jgi:RNA polymerase sigma-70 factor (ECF subfamily)
VTVQLSTDQPEDDDRQSRLAGDAALCAYLREQKYQGPDWERFVHELLAYGLTQTKIMLCVMGVVPSATRTGTLADRGDLDELVNDIVMSAFRLFVRRGLVGGEWVPGKGTSLTTYFNGACRLVLKEKCRDWRKRALKVAAEDPRADVPDRDSGHEPD